MSITEIHFAGGAYNMPSTQLDAQTCINWYTVADKTGKYQLSLAPRPGLSLFVNDSSEDSTRGHLSLNDVLYEVIDNKLYAIYGDQSREILGYLNTSVGYVKMVTNDFQLLICDEQYGYVYQIIETGIYDEGEFFQITNASSIINQPVFLGTGINDLTPSGKYRGSISTTYRIEIDATGSPDKFRWSDDNGSTWSGSLVPITGAIQRLSNSVYIAFNSTTGHTLNDAWLISAEVGNSFYAPIFPAAQDGYGIYPQQNSNRIYISAINDFNTVDPLDYQNANVYPDNNSGAISVNQEVYIIKQQTTEVWNNVGATTEISFPFKSRSNFVINYGCEATFTICAGSSNVILMLGRNKTGARMFIKIENYTASVISTEPLNSELMTYSRVDDAFSDIIEINNHIFFYTTFPTVDKTWVYDISTNMWSEWTSQWANAFPLIGNRFGKFRGMFHAVLNGKNLIGDSVSGKIFRFDPNAFLDYDKPIERERTAPHFSSDNKFITLNKLMIDVERGVADQYGQGSEPKLMLQVSRDGGKTWGSQLWRTSGKVGHYNHRSLWYQLGMSRQFTLRLRCTDPVYNVILGVVADIEVSE